MKISEEFLGQVLSQTPSSETTLFLLQELKAQGPADRVIRAAIQALGRYPGDIRIRGLLAEACLQSGWLSRAESEVEKAAAQIEDLMPIYQLQAQIYSSLNRTKEALRCLKLYLAHRPDDLEAADLLQKLRPSQEATTASDALVQHPAESLKESPSIAIPEIATPTLAEVYFAQGQIQEAVATYEKVLVQNPEAAQSRRRLEELKALLSPEPSAETDNSEAPTMDFPTVDPGNVPAPAAEVVDLGVPAEELEMHALPPDSPLSAVPTAEHGDSEILVVKPVDLGALTIESEKVAAEHLRKKKEKLIQVLESWKESIAQPPASSQG